MSMQNPIADMLTRIRNAQERKKLDLSLPSSKVKVAICEVLKSEGFIEEYKTTEEGPKATLHIKLKYFNGQPVIEKLSQSSKPSLRKYASSTEMPRVKDGLGVCIVSTSKGVMTARDARQQNLGGELLVEVC